MIRRLVQRGARVAKPSLHSSFQQFVWDFCPVWWRHARDFCADSIPVADTWSSLSHTGRPAKVWPSRQPYDAVIVRKVAEMLLQLGWSSQTLAELRQLQVKLSPYVVVMVLKRVKHPLVAYNFFEWAREEGGCIHDRFSYTAVMRIMGQARMADKVKLLMDEMRRAGCELDTIAATTVLGSYAKAGLVQDARDLFSNLVEQGCKPDRITFTLMINMYAKNNLPEEAIETFKQMVDCGTVPDTTSYNTVLYALGKMGQVKETVDLWEDMNVKGIHPDKWTYGILMDVHGKAGQPDVCLELYKEMKTTGFLPNDVIRETLLKAVEQAGDLEAAEELCADTEKAGLKLDHMSFYTMIQMWADAGNPEKAQAWWDRMIAAGVHPSLETSNALVAVYLNKKLFQEAKHVLQLLPQWDISPSLQTASLILHCWAECEDHEDESLRGLIRLTGNSVDELLSIVLDTSLGLAYVSGWVARFFISLEVDKRVRDRFADELMNFLHKMGCRQQATCVWGHVFPDQVEVDYASGICTVNLQRMQAGTALVGLTKILISFNKPYCGIRANIPDWVQISTGPALGAQNSVGASPASAAVADMLDSLGSPFNVDMKAQGAFVARGKAVLHWLEKPDVMDILTHHAG